MNMENRRRFNNWQRGIQLITQHGYVVLVAVHRLRNAKQQYFNDSFGGPRLEMLSRPCWIWTAHRLCVAHDGLCVPCFCPDPFRSETERGETCLPRVFSLEKSAAANHRCVLSLGPPTAVGGPQEAFRVAANPRGVRVYIYCLQDGFTWNFHINMCVT